MRRFTVAERRARLGVRHRLATPAASCVEVAGDLVGLHSSDPASVLLAARARTRALVPADVERALYDDRSLARVLGMRRTMFVVPSELVPVLHAACTRALAPRERARSVRLIEEAGITDDGDGWLAAVAQDTLAALEARGQATATELAADVPALRHQIAFGQGKRWAGSMGVSTRVLFLLATEGRIVRGRPLGSWTSTQYRWAPVRSWLGVDPEALTTQDARAELVRRWLRTFGPARVEDVKWWTGWTVRDTRRALADAGAVEVGLDGGAGVALPGDLGPGEPPAPWVALLPALDPTVMGWTDRGWYLGDHRQALFDRNGNAGPTIWCDGRVVGGWAQRRDGEITIRLVEDIGSDAHAAVEREAQRLEAWLGDVRFTPRFRTPLERELTA